MRIMRITLGRGMLMVAVSGVVWGAVIANGSIGRASVAASPCPNGVPHIQPNLHEIGMDMSALVEVTDHAVHLTPDGDELTIRDGYGGYVTAVRGVRWPITAGRGQLVLFWHTHYNTTFLGWDANAENRILAVSSPRAGVFALTFAHYAPNDRACCASLPPVTVLYRWSGEMLSVTGSPPGGASGGAAVEIPGCREDPTCPRAIVSQGRGGTSATTGTPVTTATSTAGSSTPIISCPAQHRLAQPSLESIGLEMSRTVEVNDTTEHMTPANSEAVTINDGHGGSLTAVRGMRWPTLNPTYPAAGPDRSNFGQLVFFWHGATFLGWDSNVEHVQVGLKSPRPGVFALTYTHYANGDLLCCPSLRNLTVLFRWNGSRMVASRPPPDGYSRVAFVKLEGPPTVPACAGACAPVR